ncbi:MAG: ADP-heptose:LPS heptosyltransferase [Glaciecola sp.]|jgi:ADP-heptose:LPS heptosyltransferase
MQASATMKGPILLFPTHYLGNLVLCLPWIREIVAQYPDTVLVIDPRFSGLLNMASIKPKTIIFYPRVELSKEQNLGVRLIHFLNFIKQLRKYKSLDLIDLEGERFTGVLSLLSANKHRIGPTQKHSNWFYTQSHDLNYTHHRFVSYGELISQWQDINTPLSKIEYVLPNLALNFVHQLGQTSRLRPALVAIHVGASTYTKRWPVSHFVRLATDLSSHGYKVAWVGADKEDQKIANQIECQLKGTNSFNFCGKLSCVELISLLKSASLFIGADSGPMHVAASMDTPVIGLFGITNDAIWAPLGSNSKVLRGDLGCKFACKNKHCVADNRCMVSLNPQRVADAALRKLLNTDSIYKAVAY